MKNETVKKFGENVRAIRIKRKLSQETLADKTDSHPTYVSLLETGKRSAAVVKIVKIAKALNCKVSDLFRGLE